MLLTGGTGRPSMKLVILYRSPQERGDDEGGVPRRSGGTMRSKPIPIKAVPSSGSPYKMTNFNREGPGIARSNNCRGLLIALGEA